MESGKILQNPRPSSLLAFTNNNKSMPNDLAQKPSSLVIDKFHTLLKLREEDAGVGDGDGATFSTEEIVQIYETVLADLTLNSKPIITELTIIAGEQRAHGHGIAEAICSRILEVPVSQKLPSLYLLDSIVKNIGKEYVRYFSSRLPEVFCEAYRQVHPDMHRPLRHLFGTWSIAFPHSVLHKIEAELLISSHVNKQSTSVNSLRASESPRPSHGIHVNPKYIRQFEHSNRESKIQQVRGTTSNLKVHGQNPAIGYNEFESNHSEARTSQVGDRRSNPAGSVGSASFTIEANKLHPSSTARLGRRLSPQRIGSEVDEFAVENCPRRLEEASPSHQMFDYGLGKGRTEEIIEWRNPNRFETTSSSYNYSKGHKHQGPRALIDAYGSDSRASNNKPPQVASMGINGMGNKVSPRSWKNSEEEEFDWEDMSPTLVEHGRKNDLTPSSVRLYGSIGARIEFSKLNTSSSKSDNRSSSGQIPMLDGSSIAAEDPVSSLNSGLGAGKVSGFQSDPNHNLGSCYPQESWNSTHHFSLSAYPSNGRGRGRDSQIPFPGSGVSSLGVDKMSPCIDKYVDADAQLGRPPTVLPRMGASGAWAALNLHKSHMPISQPVNPQQKQTRSQFDPIDAAGNNLNHGKSLYNTESKELRLMKPPQLRDQQNQCQAQFLSPEARNNLFPSTVLPHLLPPPLNHGYTQQGHNAVLGMVPSNAMPPLPFQDIRNSSLHLQGGRLPPLPPGLPPSQMISGSQSAGLVLPNQQPGPAFSGLINSLMTQGLISLTKLAPLQDSVGLEFDADLLKLRHESAITSLYANLPRQCTTCGLRFKFQEEHSSHMDWHVTKNRMSRNSKQKLSRKWFVSASMWLSGTEALGTDSVPGFLPFEPISEKKDDEEMAVPADEDQNVCALCGEPFEDFFSDDTEEWMYKGAIYINAPNGSTTGMDRSELGPIVHAKCMSESAVIPSENFKRDEGGSSEEGSQRKKLRS